MFRREISIRRTPTSGKETLKRKPREIAIGEEIPEHPKEGIRRTSTSEVEPLKWNAREFIGGEEILHGRFGIL